MRILLVRARGVEPLWISPHGPEPCASANSAMPAKILAQNFSLTTDYSPKLQWFFVLPISKRFGP